MTIYNLGSLNPPTTVPYPPFIYNAFVSLPSQYLGFFPIIVEATLARIITYDKYGKIRDFGIYSKAYVSFPAF